MENGLLTLIGNSFIVVGALVGSFFLYRIYQAFKSVRWPNVKGDIESTELREVIYRGLDSDGTSDQASAWVTDFKYSYIVGGKKYSGTRVTYSDGVNKTMGSLRRLQKKFKNQSCIQVYYDPKNHRESLLIPGVTLYNFTPLITCSLFIFVGIFVQNYDFK